jgi:hypothetical protein
MPDYDMHEEGVIECDSLFIGPCACGPAIHICLEVGKGNIVATAKISPDEVDEFIRQIRRSKKAVLKALQ